MISSTSVGCTDSDVYSNLLMSLVDSTIIIKTTHSIETKAVVFFFFFFKSHDSFLKMTDFKEATKKTYDKLNKTKCYTSECLHWR